MVKKAFTQKEFTKVSPELASYFTSHFSFPAKFDFSNFSAFFEMITHPIEEQSEEKVFEYMDLLYKRRYVSDYVDLYKSLFMKYMESGSIIELGRIYKRIMEHSQKTYQLSENEMVYFIDFYQLLDNEKYASQCKEFLIHNRVVLKIDDLMNIVEVLSSEKREDEEDKREDEDEKEEKEKSAFLLQLIKQSDVNIRAMIRNMNVPFDLLDIFIRDKNMEIIEYLFRTYPEFIQYDNSLDTLCQVKGMDISFLHALFDKIKSEQYEQLPNFVDDENGVNLLIHKGDELLVMKYLQMIELQNYSNYINHAIEKKLYRIVDYLCGSIYRIDPTYFQTLHFVKKIQYTTLFYKPSDYEQLNAIFRKYGIEEKHNDFPIRHGSSGSDTCQICLEEERDNEDLLECKSCKKLFHIQCIFEYMRSKQKEKVEEEEEEMGQNEYQIDYVLEEEEWEDEEDDGEEDEKSQKGEEGEVEEEEVEENGEREGDGENVDGYVGTYPIVEKDDVMCIYSKWYRKMNCVHCRQPFC